MKIEKIENEDVTGLQDSFNHQGYIILKSEALKVILEELEDDFLHLLRMQLKKIRADTTGSIDNCVRRLDQFDQTIFNETATMLRNTSSGHRLASFKKFNEVIQNITKAENPLVVSGPSLFCNLPNKTTRKYTAHAEQNWYPKRRSFVNIWLPFMRNRPKNCSMTFWSGSHNKDWFYFSEYQGYGYSKSLSDNVQYEIPESLLVEHKPFQLPPIQIGEAVLFSHRMVHASHDNNTRHPMYAFSLIAYDYSHDLTLSSGWAELPYKSTKFGRAGFNV